MATIALTAGLMQSFEVTGTLKLHIVIQPPVSLTLGGSYAGCPISWASKMQTQTALSTTEGEYIALSMALREQIPI